MMVTELGPSCMNPQTVAIGDDRPRPRPRPRPRHCRPPLGSDDGSAEYHRQLFTWSIALWLLNSAASYAFGQDHPTVQKALPGSHQARVVVRLAAAVVVACGAWALHEAECVWTVLTCAAVLLVAVVVESHLGGMADAVMAKGPRGGP